MVLLGDFFVVVLVFFGFFAISYQSVKRKRILSQG